MGCTDHCLFRLALIILQEFVSFIVESGMVFADNSKVDAVEKVSIRVGQCSYPLSLFFGVCGSSVIRAAFVVVQFRLV